MLTRLRLPFAVALVMALVLPAAVMAHPRPGHGGFPSRIELPDGWRPEGITSHRKTFYAGSLADGAIWRGNLRSGKGSVLVEGIDGEVAVGIDHDRARHRLWVAGGATGEVRVYNARTGVLLKTYEFEAGFLNDLVVTRRAVYVTDSMIQQLAVIPLGRHGALPDAGDVTTLPLSGDIAFVPNEFNANGIVRAGGWLILVQSNTGLLFRVDPRTGDAKVIDTDGYGVTFGDGLERVGRTLFVVRNQLNLVAVLRLGHHLRSARLQVELSSPKLDVPTTATFAAGRLWLVNARFSTPPEPTTEYWVTKLPAWGLSRRAPGSPGSPSAS